MMDVQLGYLVGWCQARGAVFACPRCCWQRCQAVLDREALALLLYMSSSYTTAAGG